MTEHFQLTILGTASAKPLAQRNPSAQFISACGKCFLIDCGEGTQMQIRRMGLKLHRLNHIFLSHLHGDHCFGLIGLISSIGLSKRTADLTIFAPAEAEAIFRPQLQFFCKELPFKVHFKPVDTYKNIVIYEDNNLRVSTIPLRHRLPCCGFLFEKKAGSRHILPQKMEYYNIPPFRRNAIKQGEDWITSNGTIIPNHQLTREGTPPFRYAYCSDTAYFEAIVPIIKEVDLLYHEATFAEEDKLRAFQTNHSTAAQAAQIAQLANVKRLILGHYSSRYDDLSPLLKEAKEQFPNVQLGYDGMTLSEG